MGITGETWARRGMDGVRWEGRVFYNGNMVFLGHDLNLDDGL